MSDSMIEFSCIYCGRLIRAGERFVHKRIKCPACGHAVMVCAQKHVDTLKPAPDLEEEKQKEASDWSGKTNQEIVETLLPKAMTQEQRQHQATKKVFSALIPQYDDLTLFALSLSFLLLWLINADLRRDLTKIFIDESSLDIMLWLAVAVIGMALSLINVFLRREKSELEKFAMLIFAVAVTGGTGLYAGWLMLQHSRGWLLVFPAWNILNAGLLLLLFRLGAVDTDCVIDEPATFAQIVLTAICVPVLLTVCHYGFELHWAVTFSIVVAYTMSLHNAIRDVFGRRQPLPGTA